MAVKSAKKSANRQKPSAQKVSRDSEKQIFRKPSPTPPSSTPNTIHRILCKITQVMFLNLPQAPLLALENVHRDPGYLFRSPPTACLERPTSPLSEKEWDKK